MITSNLIDDLIKLVETEKLEIIKEEEDFLVDYCVDCNIEIMYNDFYVWICTDIYVCEKCIKKKIRSGI